MRAVIEELNTQDFPATPTFEKARVLRTPLLWFLVLDGWTRLHLVDEHNLPGKGMDVFTRSLLLVFPAILPHRKELVISSLESLGHSFFDFKERELALQESISTARWREFFHRNERRLRETKFLLVEESASKLALVSPTAGKLFVQTIAHFDVAEFGVGEENAVKKSLFGLRVEKEKEKDGLEHQVNDRRKGKERRKSCHYCHKDLPLSLSFSEHNKTCSNKKKV